MSPLKKFMQAMKSTGFVEVVSHNESPNSIRLICRVSNKLRFRDMLEAILVTNLGTWTPHVCQQYFLRDQKLVYAWNFGINSEALESAVDSVCSEIARFLSPAPPVGDQEDIDEIPLIGAYRPSSSGSFNVTAPGPRSGGASQKGAHPFGGG
jgi:hypothetical protein